MNKFSILLFLGVLLAAIVGCQGGGSAAADDKELRAKFAKEKFDMKDVPLNQRAMVQGYIDRSKHLETHDKAAGIEK